MNWLGLYRRVMFAVITTVATLGWFWFGWKYEVGVAIGFIFAIAVHELGGIDDPFKVRQ